MGLARMHVPVLHWLAGTLTLDGSQKLLMAAGGSQSGAWRMRWREFPVPAKRTGGVAQTIQTCQGHNQTRILGGSTTFTHFIHRPPTQQHQRARQIGTSDFRFFSLARNN